MDHNSNGGSAAVLTAPPPVSGPDSPPAKASLDRLKDRLYKDKTTRLAIMWLDRYPDTHLKDMLVDEGDDIRRLRVRDKVVWNFGSDSFLGLDRHPKVQQAMIEALPAWGTHNGASRAFTSIQLCDDAEKRVARWLGVEDTLIFTSVTLTNVGVIPGIASKGDLLLVDRTSHDSVHQGVKIAQSNGAKVKEIDLTCGPEAIYQAVEGERYDGCVVAIDGVYSMSGHTPPLKAIHRTCQELGADLYVDDAHGTGVVGPRGRGFANEELGNLNDVLMVGSLSKAFSCMGGFVTCGTELKRILKIKSSTFIFGGPVPPPYLAAICAVCDIFESPEYDNILGKLRYNVNRLMFGLQNELKLKVSGGVAPIISVLVGDFEKTLLAGKWLYDRGFYVQSATYPAVPIMGGLLRIQVNANHTPETIEELLQAFADLKREHNLPTDG